MTGSPSVLADTAEDGLGRTPYAARSDRYDRTAYRRVGGSGLVLPPICLGLWHNFGLDTDFERKRALILGAFDRGITHFDLANNYGPPPGSAELSLGTLLRSSLRRYRSELVISTKAGWPNSPGPYGSGGSRKHLVESLDESLARMGLEHVDIFYSHRFDPDTPLEETIGALADIVRQGKALYAGISSYSPRRTREAQEIAARHGVPLVIHQFAYSMLNRWAEDALLPELERLGMGSIAFTPLAQGMLTDKYLSSSGRTTSREESLPDEFLTEENLARVRSLREIAMRRGQSLAQMALAWALRPGAASSVIIGASRPEQLDENLAALDAAPFGEDELREIDHYAVDADINTWRASSEL
ncbi:aldo/keto reductase [Microbacterium sp. 179-I 3D2 NHS]|uniref:aldo/keto reductase n=1 Tax=Microbacterium sp. 179-I 3D2 NHS TaxID=3235178 RepID=UPI0039A1F59A